MCLENFATGAAVQNSPEVIGSRHPHGQMKWWAVKSIMLEGRRHRGRNLGEYQSKPSKQGGWRNCELNLLTKCLRQNKRQRSVQCSAFMQSTGTVATPIQIEPNTERTLIWLPPEHPVSFVLFKFQHFYTYRTHHTAANMQITVWQGPWCLLIL